MYITLVHVAIGYQLIWLSKVETKIQLKYNIFNFTIGADTLGVFFDKAGGKSLHCSVEWVYPLSC